MKQWCLVYFDSISEMLVSNSYYGGMDAEMIRKAHNLQKFVDKAGALPALILMEKEGLVRSSIRLPGSEQGILDAVKAAGGV